MLNDLGNTRGLGQALLEKRRSAFTPPPLVRVDEWADMDRIVGREESRIAGPFKTSNAEAARGPMMWVTEPGVHEIALKTSAQFLKTMFILNVLGYFIANDPCPILIYQPTIEDVDDFSTSKVLPMLRNTPTLAKVFGGRAALAVKSTDNQKNMKRFPGGYYELLHGGSDNSFSRRSVRVAIADEVTNFLKLKKGHWYNRMKTRTETYADSYLIIATSTPSHTGDCAITELFDEGDQRRAYIACPNCKHEDYIRWEDVHWSKDDQGKGMPETAQIFCVSCGVGMEEHERHRIMTTPYAITWRQTRPFICCGKAQRPEETRNWVMLNGVGRAACTECGKLAVSNKRATGHVWRAYSAFKPLSAIVEEFLSVKNDRDKLRTFVNEVLAETFEKDGQITSFEADATVLAERREVPWIKVPAGAKVITVGVDNQSSGIEGNSASQGRLEAEVVAWGDGDESWSLGYHVIDGDPSTAEPWDVLEDILLQRYETEDGRTLVCQAACIDTGGHHSSSVHAFCGARTARRVWGIKGANEAAGSRREIWPKVASTAKGGGKVFLIGTQSAKDKIADHLAKKQPGPGYIHIPMDDRPAAWMDQLTSEKRVVFYQGGRARTQWKPKKVGIRNEALDCRVYAVAALEGLRKIGGPALQAILPAKSIDVPSIPPSEETGDSPAPAIAPKPRPAPRPKTKSLIRKPGPKSSIWGR